MPDETDAKISLTKHICIDYRTECFNLQSPTKCWAMKPCRGMCRILFHFDNPLDHRTPK